MENTNYEPRNLLPKNAEELKMAVEEESIDEFGGDVEIDEIGCFSLERWIYRPSFF